MAINKTTNTKGGKTTTSGRSAARTVAKDKGTTKPGPYAAQIQNATTGNFITRNGKNGQYVVKQDGTPFEGVQVLEKGGAIAIHAAGDRHRAEKAERIVLKYLNESSEK